jgi:hypothetical protein
MVTDVDIYENTTKGLSLPITTRARRTNGGIVDAKLQRFFEQASLKLRQKDGVKFRFIGEKGAGALDKAEEATTRLDNLSVAREMEQSGKQKGRLGFIPSLPKNYEPIVIG